jgi:ATP:corrinoid adenosyltransferase
LPAKNACTLLFWTSSARLHLGLIDRSSVLSMLDVHGSAVLVITDRDPAPELLERADYVTRM